MNTMMSQNNIADNINKEFGMINKVIFCGELGDFNLKIAEENKNGWVVKQIFIPGDAGVLHIARSYYALLEKDGKWQ